MYTNPFFVVTCFSGSHIKTKYGDDASTVRKIRTSLNPRADLWGTQGHVPPQPPPHPTICLLISHHGVQLKSYNKNTIKISDCHFVILSMMLTACINRDGRGGTRKNGGRHKVSPFQTDFLDPPILSERIETDTH